MHVAEPATEETPVHVTDANPADPAHDKLFDYARCLLKTMLQMKPRLHGIQVLTLANLPEGVMAQAVNYLRSRLSSEIKMPATDNEAIINFSFTEAEGSVTKTIFARHIDDDAAGVQSVATLIIYVGCTANGGRLLIYKDEYSTEPAAHIDPRPTTRGTVRTVCMPGNVWHVPEDIWGWGYRAAFVIQVPRVDPSELKKD